MVTPVVFQVSVRYGRIRTIKKVAAPNYVDAVI